MPRPTTLTPAQVLKALTPTPERPSELATRLGVSRATVHRKLETLLAEGLVIRTGEGPVASYRLPTPAEELEKARSATAGVAALHPVRLVLGKPAASAVQSALDLYSRLGIGQLGEIASHARMSGIRHADGTELNYEQLDEVESWGNALKHHLLDLSPGASHGIYSPKVHPTVLKTWALQRALRHRLAWDHQPQGSMGVWHDEPMDIDSLPGLFIHSDEPDEKGQPTRYIVEMPRECVGLLHRALHTALRVLTGDVMAVLDMAREQVLRHSTGAPVSDDALAKGELIASKLTGLLSGVESGPYNAQLSAEQARLLQLVKALRHYDEAGQDVSTELSDERAVTVETVTDSPFAVNIDSLPEGMLLNFQRGKYRIIAPTGEDRQLTIVGESHSLKTAIQMAKNHGEGRPGRQWTM